MPADVSRTLTAESSAEPPNVKGSRFVGQAFPIETAGDALEIVAAIRRREHTATHVCWGYRLGPDTPAPRFSDDGEPSGSAGAPILREVEGRALHGVLAVVTRYYGGTKLGVGGLARAYGAAAGAALDAGRVRRVVVRVPVALAFAFGDTAAAMRLLDTFDARLGRQSHTAEGTRVVLDVRRSQADALRAAFVEATSGRGTVVEAA